MPFVIRRYRKRKDTGLNRKALLSWGYDSRDYIRQLKGQLFKKAILINDPFISNHSDLNKDPYSLCKKSSSRSYLNYAHWEYLQTEK